MTIRIKTTTQKAIKVKTRIAVPESLNAVDNVDISQVQDGYILMYDDAQQRYVFANPDDLLKKAPEDGSLPEEFIDRLDVDLDNKITLDGGLF
jgi:hypothetical protein